MVRPLIGLSMAMPRIAVRGSQSSKCSHSGGSKVTSTSAAASAGASSAASSYNLIEKLIQSQSQAVSNSATASVKV